MSFSIHSVAGPSGVCVCQVSGEQLFDYHCSMENEHPGSLTSYFKGDFEGELFHFNLMDHRTVLLVFLCFLLVSVRSEVQKDFSPECREFMYMGTPPRGLENRSLKKICQRYNGKPRYVTLYDVVDHIRCILRTLSSAPTASRRLTFLGCSSLR